MRYLNFMKKPLFFGLLGSFSLISFYFLVMILLSSPRVATLQFYYLSPWIISISAGFGIQVGLFTHLKQAVQSGWGMGKALAVSGTTSTIAMISCCAHYLVNIAPLIATAGVITFISQYQVQFFWIGLAFNIGGIIYIGRKVVKYETA